VDARGADAGRSPEKVVKRALLVTSVLLLALDGYASGKEAVSTIS
jgi:hypothetical protein